MFKLKQRQEEVEPQGGEGEDDIMGEGGGDEEGSPNKKQKTSAAAVAAARKKKKKNKSKKKPLDPNNLVEIIRGMNEFYAVIHFLSEWKKGTLTEGERVELLELQQQQQKEQQSNDEGDKMKIDVTMAEEVKDEKKEEEETTLSSSSIVKRESEELPAAVASEPAPAPAAAPAAAAANPTKPAAAINPYAKYAKKPVANPYAKKQPVVANSPYAASTNPYASKKSSPPAAAATSKPGNHHVDSKALGVNALWADKYAPKSSQDILGNKTNVDKLSRWLDRWEGTFNNPKMKVKSLTAPNGPRKAALLSGPPGIGTFLVMLFVLISAFCVVMCCILTLYTLSLFTDRQNDHGHTHCKAIWP